VGRDENINPNKKGGFKMNLYDKLLRLADRFATSDDAPEYFTDQEAYGYVCGWNSFRDEVLKLLEREERKR